MLSVLRWTSTFVLLAGLAGCGGSTAEIKPSTKEGQMDEAQKKTMEQQMEQMKGVQQKPAEGAPPQ